MPQYEKDSTITILGEEYLVQDLLNVLVKYPATKVVEFFKDLNLNFPRELRVDTLKAVFRSEVFATRQERHNLADEMNYRLSWFNQFTEVQLVNLFKFYKKPELESTYLEFLWLTIIENITDRNISENDLANLINLSKEYVKQTPNDKHDIIAYNKTLDIMFYDKEQHIDGLIQEQIRPVLYRSSTITEIRELGKKYDVNVPKRLKKSELIDIICQELKDRDEYSEEVEAELNKMNIILIQRYAKNHDIKVSTELKKEEVIEYILSNAKETKKAYFVPSPTVYTEEEPIEEEIIEDEVVVVEEPVEEEVIEEQPIVVEKVVVKTVVVEQQPSKQLFDITSVEDTELNIVEFHGKKLNEFNKSMSIEDEVDDIDENNGSVLESNIEKTVKPKKRRNIFLTLLFIILTLVIFVTIIIVIYAFFTPDGVDAVDSKIGFLKTIVDFFRGLFN